MASSVYNGNNQLTSWSANSNSYDLNGNLTTDGTNTYAWDSRNRLGSISGATNESFSYDAFGRRSAKTLAGQTTSYLHDGNNPITLTNGSGGAMLLSSASTSG
jgi:YD repeat-containing protein